MKRYAASLGLLVALAGCHAPMPSFNLLAPYGTTRVPPPQTGAFGAPNGYYQPSFAPPAGATAPAPSVGTGVRAQAATDSRWSVTPAETSAQLAAGWSPTRADGTAAEPGAGAVVAASYETSARLVPSASVLGSSSERDAGAGQAPIRIVSSVPVSEGAGSSRANFSSPPRLRGMAVNDATQPGEPARFEPPADAIDISQLPRPQRTPSAATSASVSQAAPRRTVVAGQDATVETSGWHARAVNSGTIRVAGR